MKTEKTFGDLLRKQRTALGLSQEVMAERLGKSVKTISNLENGEGQLLQKLCRIGAAYEIDTWLEIFSDEVAKGIEAPKMRAEILKLNNISPEYRKVVYAVIDIMMKIEK